MRRYLLEPMDYALFRDARPFNPDELSLAHSQGLMPLPRTVYGMLRGLLLHHGGLDPSQMRNGGFDGEIGKVLGTAARAGSLTIRGPFLGADIHSRSLHEIYLPYPADVISISVGGGEPKDGFLRPRSKRTAGNWPHDLLPLMPSEYGLKGRWEAYEGDPPIGYEAGNNFLAASDLEDYLTSQEAKTKRLEGFLSAERHVGLERDPDKYRAVEGMLYGVEFLRPAFRRELTKKWDSDGARSIHYLVDIETGGDLFPEEAVFPMGGERRPFRIETLPELGPLDSGGLRNAVERKLADCITDQICRFRLYLATPALFHKHAESPGWIPDFLDPESLKANDGGFDCELKSAAMTRSFPVSGWNLAARSLKEGPREGWLAVPGGAVYFLEAKAKEGGDASVLPRRILDRFWLQSICEDEEEKKMGFGLVLVGGFDYV